MQKYVVYRDGFATKFDKSWHDSMATFRERRLIYQRKSAALKLIEKNKFMDFLHKKKHGCAYFYDEDAIKTVIKQEVIIINDNCESAENQLNTTIVISDDE